MRNNSVYSKMNISASLTSSQIKEKKSNEPISSCCPLVTEKVVQVVPINLYSTVAEKSKSVKKDNDIKNLLLNTKSKSYIVTKNSIIPTNYNKASTGSIKMFSNFVDTNIKKVSNKDISIDMKDQSFLSNSKSSIHSRLSSTVKSDLLASSTQRSNISENKTSTISSEMDKKNEATSVNDDDDEEDSISTNSLSEKNDGGMILDDFLIIEEKLSFIKTGLKNSKNCSYLCWEWWNYSNYSDLKDKMEALFRKQNLLKDASILETLGIFIVYGISFDDKFSSYAKMLFNLISMIYQNFLLACEYYLSKISNPNYIINRTKNIINEKLENHLKNTDSKTLIRKNNNNIFNSIRDVLDLYNRKDFTNKFAYFLANLPNISLIDINDFFKNNLLRKIDKNSVALIQLDNLLDNTKKVKTPVAPFIKTKPKKQYTLILDLDETLIHLKLDKTSLKGIVTFRPGLFDFLEEMSMLYELIVFTCGTIQYAEQIIDSIEKKKKFFDHRLYRDHCQFANGEYVKDLSLIGRDISKTIIVDNIPQNFRLQKENGIFIKSFYSDNTNDDSLTQLAPILKSKSNLKLEMITSNPQDIRKELLKWRNDIVKKISTNLSQKAVSRLTVVNNINK